MGEFCVLFESTTIMFILIKCFYRILVFESAGACENCWRRKKNVITLLVLWLAPFVWNLSCKVCHIFLDKDKGRISNVKLETMSSGRISAILLVRTSQCFLVNQMCVPDPSALVNSTATKVPILKHGNNVDDESNYLLSLKIHHDLKSDTVLTRLDTHSSGRRLLFEVADSNELMYIYIIIVQIL